MNVGFVGACVCVREGLYKCVLSVCAQLTSRPLLVFFKIPDLTKTFTHTPGNYLTHRSLMYPSAHHCISLHHIMTIGRKASFLYGPSFEGLKITIYSVVEIIPYILG